MTSTIKRQANSGFQEVTVQANSTIEIESRTCVLFMGLTNNTMAVGYGNNNYFTLLVGSLPSDVSITKPTNGTLRIVNGKSYGLTGFIMNR